MMEIVVCLIAAGVAMISWKLMGIADELQEVSAHNKLSELEDSLSSIRDSLSSIESWFQANDGAELKEKLDDIARSLGEIESNTSRVM